MTNLTAAVPHIVDQVDRGRPGWDTKARLLTIVAWRTTTPGSWTWIDRAVLAEYQRSGWEARWDLAVLEDLAGPHRILRRAPGAPLWRLAGDDVDAILRWRHVPWIGTRRSALAAVKRCVGVARVAVGPGQTVAQVAVTTRYRDLSDLDLSVEHPPNPPHQPPPPPHPCGPDQDFYNPQPPPAPRFDAQSLNAYGLRSNPSVSSGETDGQTEELRSLTKAIAQVCFEVSGDPITGAPLRRAQAIAERHLDHADDLRAFAASLLGRGLRRWGGVLDALDGWGGPASQFRTARPECGECGALLASDGFCCGREWS